MNKLKLILASLLVLAVQGGVLAFKSSKDLNTFYTSNGHDICDVATQSFSVEDPRGEIFDATTQAETPVADCKIRLISAN
jgi:hypothetical protein